MHSPKTPLSWLRRAQHKHTYLQILHLLCEGSFLRLQALKARDLLAQSCPRCQLRLLCCCQLRHGSCIEQV